MRISEIWIEAERWAEGELNPVDDSSDVIVTFENGEKWVGSFFTYKNIKTISEKNRATGECLGGSYFWASDMILIEEIGREKIEKIVSDLIRCGEFETAFSKCSED